MEGFVEQALWCLGALLAGYGVGGVYGYEWVEDVKDFVEKVKKWKDRFGK